MSRLFTRRALLERSVFLAAGAALGRVGGPLLQVDSQSGPRPPALLPAADTSSAALSLTVLQREAQKADRARTALPKEIVELGGLNRIRGFVVEEGGDVVLFGDRDGRAPQIHIDDLMVSVRSAYQTESLYREAPGCSIDPRDDAEDPWAIQDVRVLGMPRCRMAHRHVALDYELKFVGSGIAKLDGVRDAFTFRQNEQPLCGDPRGEAAEVQNRFWFAALYPEAQPRFEVDDRTVVIRHPVDVQVLTEQRLRGGSPETTAGLADPAAEQFAASVTQLLVSGQRREYGELRNDFRVIEVGRLLRFRQAPIETFAYLLQEHDYEPVEVPHFVVGIRRTEQVEVVCGGNVEVTEHAIQSRATVQHRNTSYRGGVDASVETPPTHFADEIAGRFAELRMRIRQSRPSAEALIWSI